MKHLTEETTHSTLIYQGKIISVQVDDVRLPDGTEGKREIVKHPGAVAIIPFKQDDTIVLVRQFRKPLEKEIYEIPAGKLEAGEDPLTCSKRELKEETGYTADRLEFVTSFYTSPGFANELLYLFVASGLRQGQAEPDLDEFVENVEVSLDEAFQLMETEQIHDAKTIFALYYLQNLRLKRLLCENERHSGI